jgi:hypothetical protein
MFGLTENGTEAMDIITTIKVIGPTIGLAIPGTVVTGTTGQVAMFGSRAVGINLFSA